MGLYEWISFKEPSNKDLVCYHIEGFLDCAYFHNAVELGDKVSAHTKRTNSRDTVKMEVKVHPKSQWNDRIQQLKEKVPGSQEHRTSPFIYEGCSTTLKFIGGYTDFFKLVQERHK
ncbi:hypothetical protein K7432_005579 [Basidiobolus ranarum]|uniref:Uncharacterized protein n=1 Tax=Basidiobolus ranarum TaxID=34480 RepID=A0ABR2WW90_9FUNG